MQGSLRRLLTQSIDYAGLFPPAQLSLEESVSEFKHWSRHAFSFALGRFCCPVDQLAHLLEIEVLAEGQGELAVSAIGGSVANREEWNRLRAIEAKALNEFQSAAEGRAEIHAYEVRVPDHKDVDGYFEDLQGFSSVDIFAELPWDESMPDSVAAAAEADWLALKARTGGAGPNDVPPSSVLAEFIWSCMSLEVPFKLTAGLHHPLPDEGNTRHGFLNALTASVLAFAHDLPALRLEQVLKSRDPQDWTFTADGMQWRDDMVSMEEIDATREIFTAFGSCSVDEPYHGLAELGWV